MKEVFLLPTKNETLFPLSSNLSERNSIAPKEGEKPFREYLEEVKSPSQKSLRAKSGKEIHELRELAREGDPIQPEEGNGRVAPVEEEISAQDSASQDAEAQTTQAALLGVPQELSPTVQQSYSLTLNLTEADPIGAEEDSLGREGQTAGGIFTIADRKTEHALSLEVEEGTQANQAKPIEKTFANFIQAPDTPPSEGEEAEVSKEAGFVRQASSPLQRLETSEGEVEKMQPDTQGKQGGTPAAMQPASQVEIGDKLSTSFTKAPESAAVKISVASGRKSAEPEVLQNTAKEGVQPETVQANAPPLNSVTNKPIEPARLAEAHRPEIVQQVAKELERFAKSGENSLRVQLYPEQLGRIEVRLISKSDGVQIVIRADNADTASLLERNLNDLRESLVQAGVNLSGLAVGSGQTQTRSGLTQDDFRAPPQGGGKLAEAVISSASSKETTPKGWRDSSSTIDYRI